MCGISAFFPAQQICHWSYFCLVIWSLFGGSFRILGYEFSGMEISHFVLSSTYDNFHSSCSLVR